MIDARDAIGIMAALAFAGSFLLTRPDRDLARWWHRLRCDRCARAARRGTVVWP